MSLLRYYSLSCGVEYIEIPKCASTSIKIALAASDGVSVRQWPHADQRWRRCPGDFVPCEVFTFVRHPLARLQSAWREKLKTGKARRLGGACPLPFEASFAEWVKWITDQRQDAVDKHWRPQTLLLASQPACGFIGKLERLEEDWAELRATYGLPAISLENRSSPDDPNVDAATRRAIERFYSEDLERFGYEL